MHVPADAAPIRSLASIRPGELLRIERILFDATRARCREAGLREGDLVLCSEATPGAIWLETMSAGEVVLERSVGRFVQVAPPRPPGEAALGVWTEDARPGVERQLERPL